MKTLSSIQKQKEKEFDEKLSDNRDKTMIKGDRVKVISSSKGDEAPMVGKVGVVEKFGDPYYHKGKPTRAVFVELDHFGYHIFNDYHLELIT